MRYVGLLEPKSRTAPIELRNTNGGVSGAVDSGIANCDSARLNLWILRIENEVLVKMLEKFATADQLFGSSKGERLRAE